MVATLHDVARAAGVSIRTVTNVLNGQVRVSKTSTAKVHAAIEKLDYRPNLAARNLRTGKTGILALVVPDLAAPYFSALASVVLEEGNKRGFQVIVEQGDLERGVGKSSAGRMPLADIVLFASDATSEEISKLDVERLSSRLVFLGEYEVGDRFSQVGVDNFLLGIDATRALLERGCKKIAVIGDNARSEYLTPRRRTEGYSQMMREAGFPVANGLIRQVSMHTREEGYRVCLELMRSVPEVDGIFCYSDTLAIGALAALRSMSVEVPQDVRLIGVDDIEEGRFYSPTLSSVSLDLNVMVSRSFELVEAGKDNRRVVLQHGIVHRESTN